MDLMAAHVTTTDPSRSTSRYATSSKCFTSTTTASLKIPEEKLGSLGSTAILFRVRPGVVLKAGVQILEDQVPRERPSVAKHYFVERQILERLGDHPRIVRYARPSLI